MRKSIMIHFDDSEITATNDVLGVERNSPFNSFKILQDNNEVDFSLPIGKEEEFVTSVVKAFKLDIHKVLIEQNEILIEVVAQDNECMKELYSQLELMEESKDKEIDRLRERLGEVENEVDYLRNGKISDDGEMY